jgi:P-type E1-E2 ATPase
VPEEEYQAWSLQYQQALTLMTNREEEVDKVANEIETGFELVGSTAIEDKLQDEVAETIEFMKRAGIKLWVLTGDKIETAINIGISCKLLTEQMEVFIVEKRATADIME